VLACGGYGRAIAARRQRFSGPLITPGLVKRDRDEARAEQEKTRCGQYQKSIGDEIVTTHDAPAVFPMIARLY
jgi:hypothetical protein